MEQLETRDDAGAGRTQHAIHILPRDEGLAASLVHPSLERVELTEAATQVLVIAPDRDAVFALAAAVNGRSPRSESLLVPIVYSPRGERRLQADGGARAICATAEDLVSLMSKALFKPQQLRAVAVVWADEQLSDTMRPVLETVLAEIPKEADRMLLVSALHEAVEQVATGFLWRARRMQHGLPSTTLAAPIEYAVCVPEAKASVVRLLLERFDPARTALVVYSDAGALDARETLAALGYGDESGACRIVRDRVEGTAELAIVMEIPGDVSLLANARGDASRVIALVPPSRAVAVTAALGDGGTPINTSQTLRDAYTARDVLRDEVLSTLRGRPLTSEVLALESLAAERDPLLIAAALWRLLETERGRARKSVPTSGASRVESASPPPPPPMRRPEVTRPLDSAYTRLFINIGERDGVRRGDLVGAITGEAGIDGSMIGKIELRDSHALVEVSSGIVDQVISRLTGVSLRGRKVAARVDGGRPAGDRPLPNRPMRREGAGGGRDGGRGAFGAGRPSSSGGGRPSSSGRSGPGRGGPRGPRDAGPRRDDGARKGRGAAGPRDEGRGPRVMREAEEWGSRSESLRNARRKRDDT